jgi:hypothetical protein
MVRALLLAAVCEFSIGLPTLTVARETISEKARKLHFSSIAEVNRDAWREAILGWLVG